jgi:hypothetical protein
MAPRLAPAVTIRYAFPDDDEAVARLAALDSQAVPAGPLLVAEVGGELWAAVALRGSDALGDPFRPTAELIGLLRERARQLTRPERRRRAYRRTDSAATTTSAARSTSSARHG